MKEEGLVVDRAPHDPRSTPEWCKLCILLLLGVNLATETQLM